MIQLTDNLEINKPAPVDDRLGVFASTAEALAYIAEDRRYIGLTFIVDTGTGAHEYWFENGIQDGDLTAKSTGTTQVNSDWNATSGVAQILNKPTIPNAQVNSDWNASSGVAQILNKPTIPTTLPPSGTAGGDLSGTYPNPTVDRIHGVDFQSGTPSAGDVWIYGGSPAKWQHQSLTKSDVGLGNVPNLDATNPANISQNSSYRFVTDTEKSTWNGKQDSLGFTPENVANKSTSVTTDQASNIKYPSVKAVFDWAVATFTTTSAVASQITTALTGYATQAWVNSQGFITNVISALGFTPENVANKQTDLTASATKYPTVNAVNTGLNTRSYSIGSAGSASITIATIGVSNLVTVSGHTFTINEADMPIGATIQVNGVVERTTGTTGNCGIAYDVNGTKRYYIINTVTNAHQLQYQFTLYRESSTSIRLVGGSSATPIAMTFGSANIGTATATVTGGGNIVLQISGWGTVASEVFAFRFFKAILTR